MVAWVLENITHKKISDFFSEAIWKKIGTEYDAYWNVDERSGLIKASSSFHCTAIDLAKIGLLYLKGGKYQETEIIPASWIEYTVGVEMFRGKKPVIDTWWRPSQNFFWWFSTLEPIGDYYADGYKGQFLYINPNLKTIIVKFSDVEDELHDTICPLEKYRRRWPQEQTTKSRITASKVLPNGGNRAVARTLCT